MNGDYWQNGNQYAPALFSPPYSTMGRVITGRSHPGLPERPAPVNSNQTRLYQNQRAATRRLEGPDWGMFVGGLFVGGIITLFLATTMGRRMLCAMGRKVERRIR